MPTTAVEVTLFGFPGDENLKQKWIYAIKRKGFSPSKTSKVRYLIAISSICILSFVDLFIFFHSEKIIIVFKNIALPLG